MAACAPSVESGNPRAPLLVDGAPSDQAPSPAVWIYHPRKPARLRSEIELASGVRLYAGDLGERWLYREAGQSVSVASALAGESLVGIWRDKAGTFRFLGENGSHYTAHQPLGPFVTTQPAPERFVQVASGAGHAVAIASSGQLYASQDAGAQWAPVGPRGVLFQRVAVVDEGLSVALALPEDLWSSGDRGRSWVRTGADHQGVTDLAGAAGALLAQTIWGPRQLTWDGEQPRWAPIAERPRLALPELPVAPGIAPDANAIADERALINAGRYVELERDRAQWTMHALALSPRERTRQQVDSWSLELPLECGRFKIAAYQDWFYLACALRTDLNRVQFLRSSDGGHSFALDSIAHGDIDAVHLAVGAAGALVASGLCEPTEDSKCSARGVRFRRSPALARPKQANARAESTATETTHHSASPERTVDKADGAPAGIEMAVSAAPGLTVVGAVAFDPDGRKAYAVGRRSKNDALTLYVSSDGGQRFDVREIEQARLDGSGQAPKVEALTVTSSGHVGLALKRYETSHRLLFLDAEGQLVAATNPPDESSLIGVFGHRAVALSDSSRQIWESLDAGVSWQSLGSAPAPLCSSGRCDAAIACSGQGCVFGANYSRFGWAGQADAALAESKPSQQVAKADGLPRWATPVQCSLDSSAWTPVPELRELPTASAAALGSVIWFASAIDVSTGAVELVSVTQGRPTHLERRRLLAPLPDPEHYALAVSRQIEGLAALRYRLPSRAGGPLGEVEVGWVNLFSADHQQMKFNVSSPWSLADAARDRPPGREAVPHLLTIAEHGLYTRPLVSLGHAQPTYYLHARQVRVLPALESFPKAEGQYEMLGNEQDHQHLFISKNGSVIAQIDAIDAGLFGARSVGLVDPSQFQRAAFHSIGYKHTTPVYYYLLAQVGGGKPRAWTYPLTLQGVARGEPEPAPTQADLEPIPVGCSASEVRDTARVVAPQGSGPARPVLVSDAIEPTRVMLTGAAVMHGSPESACVRVFDAQIVEADKDLGIGSEHALINVEDLERSWLFRVDPKAAAGEASAQFRHMTCRFDPSMPIPPSLEKAVR